MPNADDLFNQLQDANAKLGQVITALVDVRGAVNQVNTTLTNALLV